MTTVPESQPGPAPDAAPTAELPADDDVLARAADVVDEVEREFSPADAAALESLDSPRRLLLVHAHPDDETIAHGATMARYAAAGAHVTLVTCTRGERGEVVDPALAHLEGDGPALAAHRVAELATAMVALGVRDHRFLDAAHLASEDPSRPPAARYEDSGMVWSDSGRVAVAAPDTGPDAFARCDPARAAARLAGVLREVRPQVLLTYDATGGYGHPDHVRAREVAVAAVALAADPDAPDVAGSAPWQVAKVYEAAVPRSALPPGLFGDGTGELPGMVVEDDQVSALVDAPEQLAAKTAALRAHSSQLSVRAGADGRPEFTVAHDQWLPVTTTEAHRLWPGSAAPASPGPGGVETDLFAGLAL